MVINHHDHDQCLDHVCEILSIHDYINDRKGNGMEWVSVYNYGTEWKYYLKNSIETGMEWE